MSKIKKHLLPLEFGLYIHLMQPSYKRKQPQNRYRGVVLRIMAQVFWVFSELRVIHRTITVQKRAKKYTIFIGASCTIAYRF